MPTDVRRNSLFRERMRHIKAMKEDVRDRSKVRWIVTTVLVFHGVSSRPHTHGESGLGSRRSAVAGLWCG